MGPPKSVAKESSAQGGEKFIEVGGARASGWIKRKSLGDGKTGKSPPVKKVPEKEKAIRKPGPLLGGRGQAPKIGAVAGRRIPEKQKERGNTDPETAEGGEEEQKEELLRGTSQLDWTQVFAGDLDPPLEEQAPVGGEGTVSEAKEVKRGLFAASLMSPEEQAAEERAAKEKRAVEEEKKMVEEKAEEGKTARGKGGRSSKQKAAGKSEPTKGRMATRVSARQAQKGVGDQVGGEGRVADEAQGPGLEAVTEEEDLEVKAEAEPAKPAEIVLEEAAEENDALATEEGDENEVVRPPPRESTRRYKQTAKRRVSNEVTESERAALQKRLDRGFEDTEDVEEEEESESDEEGGELEKGKDTSLLFLNSQVGPPRLGLRFDAVFSVLVRNPMRTIRPCSFCSGLVVTVLFPLISMNTLFRFDKLDDRRESSDFRNQQRGVPLHMEIYGFQQPLVHVSQCFELATVTHVVKRGPESGVHKRYVHLHLCKFLVSEHDCSGHAVREGLNLLQRRATEGTVPRVAGLSFKTFRASGHLQCALTKDLPKR